MLWILVMAYCHVNSGCESRMINAYDSENKCKVAWAKDRDEKKKNFKSEPTYHCLKISSFTEHPYKPYIVPSYNGYNYQNR